MSQVRKVRVVAWKAINLDKSNTYGLVVDYMDGARMSYPVGSQLDAHRQARQLETTHEPPDVGHKRGSAQSKSNY